MSPLIAGEYEKLTPFQKSQFHELSGWQTAHNSKQSIMSDAAMFKVLDWVKKLPTPEPVAEVPQEE